MTQLLEVEDPAEVEPAPSPPVEAPDTSPPEEKDPDEEDHAAELSEVAREVIAGHWGRGNERKQRLQEAGYDVAKVSEEMAKIYNQ